MEGPPFVKKTWSCSNEEGVSIYMACFKYIRVHIDRAFFFFFLVLLSNQEEVSIHLMRNQVPHLNGFKYIFEHIASHPVFSVPIRKGNMFDKFLIYP